MPIRNEGDFIARSLEAILEQDHPHERLEIIVIDGMSTDDTRGIVNRLAAKTEKISIRILDNPIMIVPTAMNIGIREARGSVIIRVDGHCEIASDYVSNCVKQILQENVDAVGGSVETIGETSIARAIAYAMSSPFGVGDAAFRTVQGQTMVVDTVPFPAYTRYIIERAGPYDEEQVRNQDDEYNYRLRSMGAKILLAADVKSKYYSRASIRSLWQQYSQYGFWKVRVMQKHPKQMRLRQFAPPTFVASLLGAIAITPYTGLLPFGLLAGLYFIANLTASVITAIKQELRALPLLPVAFATLHLSYGSGFLVGLMRFWNRWGNRQNRLPTWDEARKEQTVAKAANIL